MSLARALLDINTLDVRLHEVAEARFQSRVEQYGGWPSLRADTAFLRRFRAAFFTLCLGCCGTPLWPQGVPEALQQLGCSDYVGTCRALDKVGTERPSACFVNATPISFPKASRDLHNRARAEHALVEAAVSGCKGSFHNVTVCHTRRPQPPICMLEELCLNASEKSTGRRLMFRSDVVPAKATPCHPGAVLSASKRQWCMISQRREVM